MFINQAKGFAMTIDSHYIPAFSIEDVLLDKDTGAPLSGGLVYFEQDNQRGVLKPVYQITGTSPNYSYTQLPNPMVLSAIGTFEDSLSNPTIPYFFPYDADVNAEYYYVRVTSSVDVPQFAREAQPYISTSGMDSVSSAFENEISNPQFAEVLFDTSSSTYVYNFNAAVQEVVNIAPDWDIVVSCTAAGTVTVSQLTPAGSLNVITNPGTILSITSAGLSRLRLRQRIYGSPNLWGSGFIAASFVAKTYSGGAVGLTLYYSQSNGVVIDEPIVTATLLGDGLYAAHPGSASIPMSDSTEFFPNSYIDIEFDIPLSVHIDITSLIVAMTGDVSIDNITYNEDTQNRQIDHLFHYYKPQLEFKPIPSLLVGWDFPLNPAQALGDNVTLNTTAAYIWDQTICQSVVGNIAVARSAFSSGFEATTANNLEAFYMLQYLDGNQAREILGNKLSVNVNAFRSQTGGAVICKVYLYSGRSVSTFPTLPTTIGTIDASGIFTLTAANWSLIPRGNLGQASGALSIVSAGDYTQLNDVEDLQFNGWELDDSTQISDTTKFAIVVTFSCPTAGTVVTADSISLVKGDVSTRPSAQTFNQVLSDCQYYYEKSYNNTTVPGNAAGGGLVAQQVTSPMTGSMATGVISVIPRSFGFQYNTIKRTTAPLITLYSPQTGASPRVYAVLFNGGSNLFAQDAAVGNWTETYKSSKDCSFIPNGVSPLSTSGSTTGNQAEAYIVYHYVVNARIGQVA